jgi:hypothetical protein
MVKHSRKMRGGVVSLPDIDKAVETVNELASQLKAIQMSASDNANGMDNSSTPEETSSSLDMSNDNSEPVIETSDSTMESTDMESPDADLSFKTDKDYKYSSPGSRVTLSYPRIIMLLQKNPSRASVMEQLVSATSKDQVQTIIDDNKLIFSSNSVGGKTKKRAAKKRGGKRTMRR